MGCWPAGEPGQQDEVFLLQVLGPHDTVRRQPVTDRQGDDSLVLEGSYRERAVAERKCGDTDVVAAGGDAIPDLLRRQAIDRYLETWQPATEFGDEAWRETGCHRWQRRNPQRSGPATAKVVRKGTDLRQTDEGSFHLGQESRGFVGRHDQIAASTEQRQAELVFEVANETTDCWLGDLDHLGRGGHGAGRHDRAEGFDLAGLDHGWSIIRRHTC